MVSSEDPTSLGLQEVTVLVSLEGKDPATGDPIPDMTLSCVDQVEHFIVKPRFALEKLGFKELLLISSCLFLPISADVDEAFNDPCLDEYKTRSARSSSVMFLQSWFICVYISGERTRVGRMS